MSLSALFSNLLNSEETQAYTITRPFGRKMTFIFRYTYVGSSWRAYILSSPSYGNRSTGLHDTHRYFDNDKNLYYVCWTVALKRLEEIIEVSRVWARETAKYIDTGESF